MNDTQMIDDIIATLDQSIGNGVGHLDIHVNEDKAVNEVETIGCNFCSRVDAPPKVPSLSKKNTQN